jgi:hypothetical protein
MPNGSDQAGKLKKMGSDKIGLESGGSDVVSRISDGC